MKLFKLNQRVLSFRPHPFKFLNGLTSNDLSAPKNAFLNFHGRIIAVFDQIQVSEEEMWIVVAEHTVDALKDHLGRYLKLGGVIMTVLDHSVYFDLEKLPPVGSSDVILPQKGGRLILSRNQYASSVSQEEFNLFRLFHHIPLHGVDFMDEMILNVSDEYVSFTKGCYLGQEFVAKVHNRSKPTWKLVVKNEQECLEEEKAKMTSRTFDPLSEKTLGFVFVKNE